MFIASILQVFRGDGEKEREEHECYCYEFEKEEKQTEYIQVIVTFSSHTQRERDTLHFIQSLLHITLCTVLQFRLTAS